MFNINNFSSMITNVAVAFVPVLLGIILHEVAHGWVASKRGDQTARMLGRLTLNPVPHIDPMGLLVFVLTAISPSPFIFGWAKPVPVNARNMRNPRKDMMLVSAAGSITNMLLAFALALILRILVTTFPPEVLLGGGGMTFVLRMCAIGIVANLVLAWVNLMPIPPLDGSHILEGLLPNRLAWRYSQLGRYGMIILLVLLFTGVLGTILGPLLRWSLNVLFTLTGMDSPSFIVLFNSLLYR